MRAFNRRDFLQVGGMSAGLSILPKLAFASTPAGLAGHADDRVVHLSGDGLALTPAQYAALLTRIIDDKGVTPDSYILGGVVDELETAFARVLGKERAVFMPTGTLANQLAVRALAGGPSRVIVQERSHFYLDEGDCAQTLSNLTLMPLTPGKATFTADDVQQVIDQAKGGRVLSRVSVVAIESPVRHLMGDQFDPAEMKKVVALAKREGIRLHLDGARLFLQAAYTGEHVADTAKPFDTVYVSLYKYFNAASGAILAGPRDLLDPMFHTRRMFGGGLSSVWPFAAVALHYLEGFSDRYAKAVRISEELIRGLSQREGFRIERVTPGTNLFRLRVTGTEPAEFRKRLALAGVTLSAPLGDSFTIGVNESLNRTTAAELTDAFVRARA
jgi:threonine aldolase